MADSTVGRRPGSELQKRVERAAEHALQKVASDLLGRAVQRAPKEEGTLRGSGHVEPETGARRSSTGGLEVSVIFNTPYAQAQHEGHAIMHARGKSWKWEAREYTTPGTGPKYLEQPLKEMSPRYEKAIAAAISREIGLDG